MSNLLNELRTSSFNQDQKSLYYNLLSCSQTKHQQILKLKADILFLIFTQLENKLKHYNQLKKKLNKFKNILRYINYLIAILFAGNNVWLACIPIAGILLTIISTTVTFNEVIKAYILKNSFENVKVTNYNKKYKYMITWIEECTYLNKILYMMK